MPNPAIRAVLWDFGGVMTDSPFIAFRRFELERGLPVDFLRNINARNQDSNAWALFERSELSPREFDEAFAEESRAVGHEVRGLDVIDLEATQGGWPRHRSRFESGGRVEKNLGVVRYRHRIFQDRRTQTRAALF